MFIFDKVTAEQVPRQSVGILTSTTLPQQGSHRRDRASTREMEAGESQVQGQSVHSETLMMQSREGGEEHRLPAIEAVLAF